MATLSFRPNARAKYYNPKLPKQQTSFVFLRGGSSADDLTDDTIVPTPPPPIEQTAVDPPSTFGMGPKSTPPGIIRSTFSFIPWNKLPNYLTYARCLAIPAIVAQFYLSKSPLRNIHTSIIFSVASITDWLDGYLARRWDITSAFGAFLDPVADKLMVSTTLVLLSGRYGRIVSIPSAIILAREIAVSALREWMASMGKRDSVKVGFQGKVKTAATMVALAMVSAVPDATGFGKYGTGWEIVATSGMGLLYLSAVITVTSGSVYFRAAAPAFAGKE